MFSKQIFLNLNGNILVELSLVLLCIATCSDKHLVVWFHRILIPQLILTKQQGRELKLEISDQLMESDNE